MVRHIPLDVILSWPKPNYINPVTRGYSLIIVNAVFISLVITFMSLRYYARIKVKRWFGSDDVMITLAFIVALAQAATLFVTQKYGWQKHIWDVPPLTLENALIVAYVAKIEFILASTFTRLSLCFFYKRLNHNSGLRWFNWLVIGSIVFNVFIGLVFLGAAIFQCSPIRAYWTIPEITGSYCLNEGTYTTGLGAVNTFADFLACIVPIPLIMKLQMPVRQRIGTIIVLCLGFFVTIAGIIRSYYTWKAYLGGYDETWYAYPLWIAATVEIDLGILCACAPALRPLMANFLADPRIAKFTGRMTGAITKTFSSNSSSARPASRSVQTPLPDAEDKDIEAQQLRTIQMTKTMDVSVSEMHESHATSPSPSPSSSQMDGIDRYRNHFAWDLVTQDRDGREVKGTTFLSSKNF